MRALMPDTTLPPALTHLGTALESSRPMLDLQEDWDGQGSPGYREATWRRASDFLLGSALRLWQECDARTPAPTVRKGPWGSIDLHWKTPTRELLINVPADPTEPADYYGDDGSDGQPIKGTLDLEQDGDHLLRWLVVDDVLLLPPVHRQRMRLRIRSTRIGTPLPDDDV